MNRRDEAGSVISWYSPFSQRIELTIRGFEISIHRARPAFFAMIVLKIPGSAAVSTMPSGSLLEIILFTIMGLDRFRYIPWLPLLMTRPFMKRKLLA